MKPYNIEAFRVYLASIGSDETHWREKHKAICIEMQRLSTPDIKRLVSDSNGVQIYEGVSFSDKRYTGNQNLIMRWNYFWQLNELKETYEENYPVFEPKEKPYAPISNEIPQNILAHLLNNWNESTKPKNKQMTPSVLAELGNQHFRKKGGSKYNTLYAALKVRQPEAKSKEWRRLETYQSNFNSIIKQVIEK